MTPFSLELYKTLVADAATHEVVTRDGRKVRVLATDIDSPDTPIAWIPLQDTPWPLLCNTSGILSPLYESKEDLFIQPKSLGWVEIRRLPSGIFESHIWAHRPSEQALDYTIALYEIREGDGLIPTEP